ncbi:MAG: ATP-binding protein [Oscillospiraceae bacterium]|nr:ATP-binding protein [Oscillospiraceae bacterium]
MIYPETVLRRAKARLEQANRAAQAAVDEIYEKYPRLREIDMELQKSMAQVVAATFAGGDVESAVREAKRRNLALQEERSWLLQANDLEESDLDANGVCPDCGGTGYIGERMCSCLRELCRQEQKKELSSLLAGKESFESFNLEYYPAETDPRLGTSPRRWMAHVFARCREYADTFSVQSPSLLFSGGTGLGKTFLSACIARQVAEMGFGVVYETVITVLRDFEKAKFGGENDDTATRKYLSCDLLILDDLGTEMLTPFAQSALYQIVNARLIAGLPTIISTNLSPSEISSTYLPQTTSRLLGTYELLQFYGDDIRMMK